MQIDGLKVVLSAEIKDDGEYLLYFDGLAFYFINFRTGVQNFIDIEALEEIFVRLIRVGRIEEIYVAVKVDSKIKIRTLTPFLAILSILGVGMSLQPLKPTSA